MEEIIYTKEITYEFNYNGDVNYEYHFVDNILNMRFRSFEEDITNRFPEPLNIGSTGEPHKVVQAELVGERVYFEDEQGQRYAELLFLLPDINHYMQIEYRKEFEPYFQEWMVLWSSRLSISLIKPLG